MLPEKFVPFYPPRDEKGFRLTRGEEQAFKPDHTNWTVDDLLYIDCVGITMPCADYDVIREEGHKHWRDQYVFEYVLSGRGHIECNNRSYDVGPGDLYFLNRLHSHHYYADAEDPFCKLWINASGKLLNSLVDLYSLSEGVIVRHQDVEAVFREMHELTASLNEENHVDVCHAISIHLHSLIQILSRSDQRETDIYDTAHRAQQIKHYIDKHINFDISLDSIAKHFSLSKAYLSRVFRQTYHITPKQYIVTRRIEAAQNMLSNSTVSIRSIAESLHFASPQHFSTAFHQIVGITPGEYRQKYS